MVQPLNNIALLKKIQTKISSNFFRLAFAVNTRTQSVEIQFHCMLKSTCTHRNNNQQKSIAERQRNINNTARPLFMLNSSVKSGLDMHTIQISNTPTPLPFNIADLYRQHTIHQIAATHVIFVHSMFWYVCVFYNVRLIRHILFSSVYTYSIHYPKQRSPRELFDV